jgi:hypothetical protein
MVTDAASRGGGSGFVRARQRIAAIAALMTCKLVAKMQNPAAQFASVIAFRQM